MAYPSFYFTGSVPVSNGTSLPGFQEDKTEIADQVCTAMELFPEEQNFTIANLIVSGSLNTLGKVLTAHSRNSILVRSDWTL